MRGLKLKTMSFDDLVALRDSVIKLITDKATSTRRDLEARLASLDGLARDLLFAAAFMRLCAAVSVCGWQPARRTVLTPSGPSRIILQPAMHATQA